MSTEEEEDGDYYDRDTGRLMTYCLSCHCYQPVRYGYSQRITGAVTLDIDGPVNPSRVLTKSTEETFCDVCGRRVYTDAESKRLEEEEATEKAQWTLVGLFALIVFGIIVVMILNAEG